MIRRVSTPSLLLAPTLLFAGTSVLGQSLDFPGTNTGPIPDGNPTGRTISFAVSGLDVPVTTVRLELGITHTYAGDLTATLVGPGGAPRLVLFGRPGTSRTSNFGDSSNLGAVYTFADTGTGGLWTILGTLGDNQTLPADFYRPTSRGAPGRSDAGGCPTSLRGVFGGMTPAEANGTWTLVVSDAAASDTGSVNSATLVLVTDRLLRDGFESGSMAVNFEAEPTPLGGPSPAPPPAHCIHKVLGDFTGDGLTDYALVRDVGGGPPAAFGWSIRENLGNGTASTSETTFQFGVTTDVLTFADLDGDRISDPVYWRPGAPGVAKFVTRLSSRNGAEREYVLGQTGDDPIQLGDYDGDAIDDVAVFRAPSTTGPFDLFWLGSGTRALTQIGFGTSPAGDRFSASGYDLDGDGRADALVQYPLTPSDGRFNAVDATSNAIFDAFTLGHPSDFIVPGHYTGNPWADVTVSRSISGSLNWFTRDSQTGVVAPTVIFGANGDFRIVGDYDGDLVADYAVWRPGAAGVAGFQVRPSLNPSGPAWSVVMGQTGDYPIANSRVK
jgi:subtilisin-like proprotein convertase family protein